MRTAAVEIELPLSDFSRGTVGGVSSRGIKSPNWLDRSDNLYGRPLRGMRVRPGTRDVSTAVLSDEPHSLMGYYAAGGNKLFVGAGVKILEVQSAAYPDQSLPFTPSSSDIWAHTNLNGALVAAQRGGVQGPIFYDGGWKELKLPASSGTMTFGADSAHAPAAGVDAGDHYYRVRWRYTNGSSVAGPVSAKHTVTAGANQKVNINNVADVLVPAAPRGDWIGWTLERTKVNGASTGPFFWVADGSATTYADTTADASLGYWSREGPHGEPPHLDGLTAHVGRLFGWAGSTLHISQVTDDLEATGIANFDPGSDTGLIQQVAKDDGDTIQVCLVVLDELLILKKRSVHVLSGTDPESFVLTSVVYADPARGSEAGCGGPRAACVIGGRAFFWGESGGLFVYERGSVKPAGWVEIGHYLDELNTAALDQLLLVNHQGNYMLAWYPIGLATRSEQQIVYDARMKQFWRWRGWRARDVIELKGGLFSSASMVFCDPLNRSTFSAIANNATITGAGIQAATLVSPAVAAGAVSLTMSLAATATAQNVTLTINGVATPHCNTTNGSTVVTISEYHLWVGFDGFKDEKASNGLGGVAPAVMFQPPWLDGGFPNDFKDLDRIKLDADGDQVGVSIAIATDPPVAPAAVQMTAAGNGNDWCADSGGAASDLEWDVGDWAVDAPTSSASGVPPGTIARRFRPTVTCAPSGDFQPNGLSLFANLLPDREYDR